MSQSSFGLFTLQMDVVCRTESGCSRHREWQGTKSLSHFSLLPQATRQELNQWGGDVERLPVHSCGML